MLFIFLSMSAYQVTQEKSLCISLTGYMRGLSDGWAE